MSYNYMAESGVVSILITRPSEIDDVAQIITPDDFHGEQYANVYKVLLSLSEQGKYIDDLTVADAFGDIAFIGELVLHRPSGSAIPYAEIVRDKARLRDLEHKWLEAGHIIRDDTIPVGERLEKAIDVMAGATRVDSIGGKTLTGVEMMREWYGELERLNNIGSGVTGLTSPFADLDKRNKGWHGGEMIVIAARPGMGKTNFAINCAWHVAKQGKHVLYFSLEMARIELMHRIAAQAEGISYEAIQTADFERAGHKITNFVSDHKDVTLHINDRAGHTMGTIRRESRRVMHKHGLDMIVIDHIGLLDSSHDNQYNKMTEISRQIKLLAKELDVPVMALTQLNRSVENRQDPRPKMSDLRDSGAIEQDADIVAFPFREISTDGEQNRIGQLIIAKLRHGETGVIPMIVDFGCCRFLPADQSSLSPDWYKLTPQKKGREL